MPSLSWGGRGVFAREGALNLILRGKAILCRELEWEETGETAIRANRTV